MYVYIHTHTHARRTRANSYDVFITAATDNCALLWDLRAGKVVQRFTGHVNRAQAVGAAFSPCMRYIACGSEDKACYMYDIRTGTYVEKMTGHTDAVSDVDFNPLYPQLATACFDGSIRFFSDGSGS